MISYTESGIGVVEGPQFSGKSTEMSRLSKTFDGQLVVVPESCDWVGGNVRFPSLAFNTLEDAKKSTHFFLELERRRCDYALDMKEKTGLPVVMDRISPFSSLLLYKLLQDKYSSRFKFGGLLEQGVETFQVALEQGKIFLPDRMVLMVPQDEETFLSRLNRGGSLGPLNKWESIQHIVEGYKRIARIQYPESHMTVESRNFDPRQEQISMDVMKFLESDLNKTPSSDLYEMFDVERPESVADESEQYREIGVRVNELVNRAKSEYRKIDEGVAIRPAVTPADAEAFKSVVLSVLKHEWGFEYDPNFSYDLDHPFEVYGKGEGKFFILEAKGKVVGTVAVEDLGEGVAHWRRLMILPEFRDKGWGVDMNKLLIDYCKAHKFKTAQFDTLKNTGMWKKYQERWNARVISEEPEGDNTKVFMEVEIDKIPPMK